MIATVVAVWAQAWLATVVFKLQGIEAAAHEGL